MFGQLSSQENLLSPVTVAVVHSWFWTGLTTILSRPATPSLPIPYRLPELLSLVNRGAHSKAGVDPEVHLTLYLGVGVVDHRALPRCCCVVDVFVVPCCHLSVMGGCRRSLPVLPAVLPFVCHADHVP